MNLLNGLSLIALPLGYFLTDDRRITAPVWFIAVIFLATFGLSNIKHLVRQLKAKKTPKHLTANLSILIFSAGLASAAVLWNRLITFDWGGLLLLVWLYLGMCLSTIISVILLIALWLSKKITDFKT